MTATRFAASLLVLTYLASSTVVAQCEPGWLPAPAPLYGIGPATVRVAANWDPDGDGPAAPVLVVGGSLTNAGERTIGSVSTWDGVDWSPLGFLGDTVWSLAMYRGDLIAGGSFDVASGSGPVRGLARWTGTEWEPFAAITRSWGVVSTLAVIGDDLYIGGLFDSINGIPCRNIAKWDGESWDILAGGIDGPFVVTICPTSIGVVVGGFINRAGGVPCRNIALWNGESWQTMGAGFFSYVNTVLEFEGSILAGGAFSASGSTQARGLARWNGSAWEEFGGGATGGEVLALDVVDDVLYACGLFDTIGGTPASGIARWTGAGWVALPDSEMTPMGVSGFQTRLVAFGLDAMGVVAMGSSGDWEALGPRLTTGDAAYATSLGSDLYVSGLVAGSPAGSSGFLRLNNGNWDVAIGTGRVVSSLEFNGELVAGGFPRLLLRSTDSGWQPLGGGVDGAVYAMTEFQDNLIIGGTFQNAGGVASRGVAAWTGDAWQPMGVDPPLNVYALVVHNGELYAGGAPIGSPPSGRVVRWNGSAWVAVAGDMNQGVDSLISFGGRLIAAGRFGLANGNPANYVVALDESGWTPIGGGADLPVTDLVEYEGDLIAVGSFRAIGGVTAYGLARWNGSNWTAFPGEINGVINSVAVSDGDLLIAGDFTRIGDLTTPFFARWGSRPVGDLDDDRAVGIQDLANLLASFGACPGDENYNAAAAGLAGDECVGLDDLAVLLQAFGSTCP